MFVCSVLLMFATKGVYPPIDSINRLLTITGTLLPHFLSVIIASGRPHMCGGDGKTVCRNFDLVFWSIVSDKPRGP